MYSAMPGMRVFRFAFLRMCTRRTYLITTAIIRLHIPARMIITPLSALFTRFRILERKRVTDYPCADPCNIKQLTKAAVFAVFRSKAPLATVPLRDILGYGKDTRKNTPGTSVANWAFRVAEWQLKEIDTCEQRYVNTIFSQISDT